MQIRHRYSVLTLGIIGLITLSASAKTEGNSTEQEEGNPQLYIPATPTEAEWCGEKVAIDNEYFKERLDREILNFTYSHSSTIQMLKRANRYFPQIERILKEEGMPDDIKYLAAIESSLNPRSYSAAKAVGMWQIIPGAAKDQGLQVDDNVDERYNLERATRAACKYLRHAHELLGSWSLTAASYNAGLARLLRLSKQQEAKTYYEMNMTEETNRYIFRLLAAKEVMTHPKKYGFNLKESDLYHEVECDTLGVDTTIGNLAQFSVAHGANYNLLKEENLWLRSNTLPNPQGKHYVIRLPKQKK